MKSVSDEPDLLTAETGSTDMGENLRARILSGGTYLAVRQVLGIVLSLCGVVVITRIIGPSQYGLYVSALGICTFAQNLGQAGIGIYLIRQPGRPEEEDFWVASTVLLIFGTVSLVLLQVLIPLLSAWVRMPGLAPLLRVLALLLPVQLLSIPAMAKLEKALAYRKVASIEFVGQLIMYAVSIPLAFAHFGAWALVIGLSTQQVLLFFFAHYVSHYLPRPRWDRRRFRLMLGYSVGYSSSTWIWQARSLVNPLIVGKLLGAEAAGYVGITIRVVELLTFIKSVTWRVALSGLARIQDDRGRLLNAIREGMRLQILLTAPPLVAFSWIGVWMFPRLFGTQWQPVAVLFPFIAVGSLVNAVFNLHSSALYVLKYNLDVSMFHTVHILLFTASSWILVGRLGVTGYGWAELVALFGYTMIHWRLTKRVGTPQYGIALVWAIAAALALFWRQLGLWTLLALAVAFVWPGTLQQLRTYAKSIKGAVQHA